MAAWDDLAAVPALTRAPLAEVGLLLWLERPPAGRLRLPADTDQPSDSEQPHGS
jgi:hypothetical protein